MKKVPLSSLRPFEAAARHGSFVKAAAELRLTPAGISQHVRALEAWMNIALFVRHPRGVALTAAGREFSTAVRHGLGHIEMAAHELSLAVRDRPVSVACIPSVATRWLIPRLPRFKALHPQIRVNILYAPDAGTPEAAGADLLIRHGVQPDGPATRLLGAETRPTCSAGFLATHGPFETPESLLSAELLHDETREAWTRWFAMTGIHTGSREGPVFGDFNLMVGSVIGGQGIGLCPTSLIGEEIATGSLVTLAETPSDTEKAYWLIEARGLSQETRMLRDWLLMEAG
ncbi:LysR substrate-binding domain-containing protein [Rhizobium terrae]|uniref:LysR substrate-binding domain-containing protein n=1 Tax=Rhizobium terrae TaxID=2171756 RepID=UPI000E3B61C2|nr:LysR substrate-binding domain-containing protein [Rhizobium terrae]